MTISSSANLFSFCLQFFSASGSFPISWLFASDDQSIGASASPSVFAMNIQDCFPLGLTSLISLLSKEPPMPESSRLLQPHSSKAILQHSAFFMVLLSPPNITTGNTKALTIGTFASEVKSLLFNMLSRFVMGFLPRSIF